jgi:zinc transport system substrate-binding protein
MKKLYLFLFISLLIAFISSCSKSSSGPSKPRVLVSIPPYLYFVEKIAGDSVEISTLAPEGANPHIFEPTPKQVQEAYQAKIWIRIGESFEQKIAKTLSYQHTDLAIVDLSKEVPLLGAHEHCDCGHHHHEGADAETGDLHFWMSPALAKMQAQAIAKALMETIPEHKEMFAARLASFEKELDALNEKIKEKLRPFAHQAVLVSHPAFSYFCHEYGLEQISIEVEGKEPRPQDISHVIQKTKDTPVRLVLIQEQYNNKGAIAIADKLHIPTFNVDPYTSQYEKMLLDITSQIAESP